MKFFTFKLAGQPILAWVFQLALIMVAWKVADHQMANNGTTILIAGFLVLAIFVSFAIARKFDGSKQS
ncbi:hypothetical protein [Lentilactobacillus sp. Marseille-Q4993]|uniref:hypothetical protein n=1 Tax=Lentilactobacillus sp. Marseille-Q4993 TaxID=3039492 RepID=UPI0024BD40E3|nr:hypothetical protein [Lentilactobacillus sp. Marseille-Q4993]